MFLLTHLNNQVIIGPRANWHQPLFQHAVTEEFEMESIDEVVTIPPLPPAESGTLIGTNLKFYKVQDIGIVGVYNPVIHNLNGPFFNFPEGVGLVEQYSVPIDKPIDIVKQELIAQVADYRWQLESGGTTVTLQGLTVSVSTARGERDIFAQALLLGSNDGNWKFPEGWLTLSNTDLGTIVSTIMAWVQAAFTWEEGKVSEINACTTLSALAAIEVRHPTQIPN